MRNREPALQKFGQNVREKRESLGLSQEALADNAELDRTYIGGIERGERNPTLISALRIAKALKLNLSDLCEGVR